MCHVLDWKQNKETENPEQFITLLTVELSEDLN